MDTTAIYSLEESVQTFSSINKRLDVLRGEYLEEKKHGISPERIKDGYNAIQRAQTRRSYVKRDAAKALAEIAKDKEVSREVSVLADLLACMLEEEFSDTRYDFERALLKQQSERERERTPIRAVAPHLGQVYRSSSMLAQRAS